MRHAKKNNWTIILVEFAGYGDTDEAINKEIGNYPHVATVTKHDADGGKDIIKYIQDNPQWSLNLVICGIYGDCCVSDTVYGLFDNSDIVEVDVVADAIVPEYMPGTELDENDNHPERIVTMADIVCLVEDRSRV